MQYPQMPANVSSNIERIRLDYERLWMNSKDALIHGHIEPDPAPDDTSRRWGISAVIRPREQAAITLEKTARQLSKFTGDKQVIYTGASLHTTLRSIEFFRSHVTHDDDRVRKYIDILQEIVRGYNAFNVLYQGLTANKTSVIAQGWPLSDDLQKIRVEFHRQLGNAGLLTGPETQGVRETAHASLVVFTHPLEDPRSLVDFIEDNRETQFGYVNIDQIDVVRYMRTDTDVELVTLGTVFLGGRRI